MGRHRKGYGTITRVTLLVLMLLLSVFSYFGISLILSSSSYGMSDKDDLLFSIGTYKDVYMPDLIAFFFAAFFAWLSFKYTMLHKRFGDFLIDVDAEMRKVTWPIDDQANNILDKTRLLRGRSYVVCGVILFIAGALMCYDWAFNELFQILFTSSS